MNFLVAGMIGALQVGLLSSSTAVHWDKLRIIELTFEFVEMDAAIFPLTMIATPSRYWRRPRAR